MSNPVAVAGPDQSTYFPETIHLAGSGSDADLDPLTYAWTKVSGPGTVTFADATDPVSTATVSVAGAYVLRLTVSDGTHTATDDVTITVASLTWQDPPATIIAYRAALLATAGIQTLLTGLSSTQKDDRFVYPSADALDMDLPYIVLSRVEQDYVKLGSGTSMGNGTMRAVIHVAGSVKTGIVEQLIDVAQQLVELNSEYLFIVRARASLANEPPVDQEAAADSSADVGRKDRSIHIDAEWEG
jgi:hypothetical protein